jgi:hypothetical protein
VAQIVHAQLGPNRRLRLTPADRPLAVRFPQRTARWRPASSPPPKALHREYVDQLRIGASARLGQRHHFI